MDAAIHTIAATELDLQLMPDFAQAQAQLTALDEEATIFCFQTFDDQKDRRDPSLASILIGTLEQHWDALVDLNRRGAGIFVTVNRTDGKGRKSENMVSPRAIIQEADHPNTPPPPLDAHIEVESSPGKFHRYWSIDEATAPSFEEWRECMNRMVTDFGSDPNACDPPRVLRVAGFFHQKDPAKPFMVRIHRQNNALPYSWQQITDVIKPLAKKQVDRTAIQAQSGRGIDNPIQLASALAAISPDCDYLDWIKVGMALHRATDGSGDGYALWDNWSATGTSYRDGETEYKWESFGGYKDTPVMLGTVFFYAREAGWDWEMQKSAFTAQARVVVTELLIALPNDPKAHLAPAVAEALNIIKASDPREYEAARIDIKQANSNVRLGALDEFVAHHGNDDGGHDDSLAKRLTKAAAKHCELWHDADGNGYASLDRENSDKTNHREHWSIGSRGFREWLGFLAHSELKAAASSEVIKSAANALAGIAKFDGSEYKPARRVAKSDDGYWIDLGDDKWRAIHVTATGWCIEPKPTIRFLRNRSTRPLPIPLPGGSIEPLWALTNIPAIERLLVLAWLLECFRSDTPYPVLELIGEQGSAKSTSQRTLRSFVDPNKVMLRGRPKAVEDVYVAAGNSHMISLENLSGLTADLSDALCTIATGGGQAGRQYYTNDEEYLIEVHNPVVVNGIGAIITRADLLDRAIALCLPVITERKTEEEHAAALAAASPAIFGGLLDLFARTLAMLPTVKIEPSKRPRMADFAQLGEAMLRTMDKPEGEFLRLYTEHRRDAIRRTVDSNPVSVACMDFIGKGRSYRGTVKGLLEELNRLSTSVERGDYWPKSPRGLGDSLRRIAPALRQIGIQVSVDSKPKRDGVHCELRVAAIITNPVESASLTQLQTSSQPSPTFTSATDREEVKL
jgi:hypothetical protein